MQSRLYVDDWVFDLPWNFEVLIPELNLLKHWERDRINEDNTAVDTGRIDNQDLLIAFLQAQETWLWILECLSVIKTNVVLAAFIAADDNTLLREARVLLYVPNLKDPVGIERVDASTALIADHVDDVVVFQGRLRPQVDAR